MEILYYTKNAFCSLSVLVRGGTSKDPSIQQILSQLALIQLLSRLRAYWFQEFSRCTKLGRQKGI